MIQEEILQKMSGENRLKQALMLSDFVRKLAIMNIKEQGKASTKKEFIKELLKRLRYE